MQIDSRAVTTSLKVAEVFEKRHKDVLRIIDRVLKETSAQNCADGVFFDRSTYKDSNNRTQPMYYINRDGFALLAMSFTGQKAMQFKMNYINAFNKMEEYIKHEQSTAIDTPSTAIQALAMQTSLLSQSIQQMAEIERKQMEQAERTKALEDKMLALEQEREENGRLLLEAPLSEDATPAMTERAKVRMLVNQYSAATNTRQQDVWHEIYNELYYKYNISINSYKTQGKESKLDIAEKHGFMHQIYNIISGIVNRNR